MDFSKASFDKERHVFISLNNYCNKRCMYCFLQEEKVPLSQPVDTEVLYSDLVHLYEEHGFRLATISGGEPGLVSNLTSIVESIARIGFSIIINTNGKLSCQRIKEIRKFNIRAISFSLDSFDKGTNDRLRFQGSWDLVQRGVDFCKEQGVPVRVSAVVCRLNQHHVSGLFEWCDAKGIAVLNIHELDSSVDPAFLNPLKLSPTEWRSLVRGLTQSTRNNKYHTALRMPISYISRSESKRIAEHQLSCPALTYDMLCIFPDLSVYRCPLLINKQRVSYKRFSGLLTTEPLDGLEITHDSARCPLSEQDSGNEIELIDACKLIKLTVNQVDSKSNTPIWSDILKRI